MIRRLFLSALVLTVGLAVAAGLLWRWAESELKAPGPLTESTVILIPKGTGLGGIAARLSAANAIRHPRLFKIAVRLRGQASSLRAGEYQLDPTASANDLIKQMREGRVVRHRFTVPEGMTSAQIVALLTQAPMLEGSVGEVPAEGSLLPETYFYVYGDSRADIIGRMEQALDDAVTTAWAARAPDLPVKTMAEVVILASIVEKETALAEERPRIAAVFLNRLKRGMKLQSDPTVVYALTHGEPLGRALLKDDLAIPSPYNTYLNPGLPPAPIASPGLDAIQAVVNPAATDDLYFVADGSGGHVFARTLAEHNRNVIKWRRIKKTLNALPLSRRDGTFPPVQ